MVNCWLVHTVGLGNRIVVVVDIARPTVVVVDIARPTVVVVDIARPTMADMAAEDTFRPLYQQWVDLSRVVELYSCLDE